jgi:ABC-type lipoprotein release transport system permease subunit
VARVHAFPLAPLAAVAFAAVVLGLLAARLPARAAARIHPARALRETGA